MTLPIRAIKKANATARFVELFDNLPEPRRRALLRLMEQWQREEREEHRRHARKRCRVATECGVQDRLFKENITNISLGGAFVTTARAVSVGENITLGFSSPSYQAPVRIEGQIVRRTLEGIGIKFKTANRRLDPMIAAL